MNKTLLLALCLLAILTIPLTFNRQTTSPPTTQTARADQRSVENTNSPDPAVTKPQLKLAGKISFGEDYFLKVSSPVQGRVVEVKATLGREVKSGDILLIIDSPDITAAYSDFLKEVSEFEFATRSYNLAKDMYETQAVAFKDLKQAENTLIKEQAEYNQAKEKLLALKVPRNELEKPLKEQKITGRFELKSPLMGTVVDRTVTPGQWVGNDPSQVLLTVADMDRLQVIADAYELDLPQIHLGDLAIVSVEAYPGEIFPAVIAKIGDIVDRDTRTVKVRAWLKNEGRKLKPEMFVRMTLEGRK
jgi:cobalt-zinc-cadmium efflux system membrane fusion protein